MSLTIITPEQADAIKHKHEQLKADKQQRETNDLRQCISRNVIKHINKQIASGEKLYMSIGISYYPATTTPNLFADHVLSHFDNVKATFASSGWLLSASWNKFITCKYRLDKNIFGKYVIRSTHYQTQPYYTYVIIVEVTRAPIKELTKPEIRRKKVRYTFDECVVCFAKNPSMGYMCNHKAVCSDCILKITECPVCREPKTVIDNC